MPLTAGIRKIAFRVRGLNTSGSYPENREDEQLHCTTDGSVILTDGLPNRTEQVRLGDSYQVMSAAFTALTAVPTTTGIFGLWNGEPGNGRCYAIDSVAVFKILIDTTQIDDAALYVQLVRPPVAALTDASITIQSMSGRYSYGGRARKAAAVTTVSGRWDAVGTLPKCADALAGTAWQCLDVDLMGRYLVPPGGLFAFHVAEVTATASKWRGVIRWHEVQGPYV
jgi:hypothetical protein